MRDVKNLIEIVSVLALIIGLGLVLVQLRQNEQLILSGSGLCLGTAPDDEPLTDFRVGRGMQRAWLALTEQNLAVQPMMSLVVLQNSMTHGSNSVRAALGTTRVQNLLQQLSNVCPQIGDGRPAFLLRFGYAEPPTGRCGRRPAR